MTYADYWHGSAELPRWYRRMDELKQERKNMELWLQGMYVYDALNAVAPVLVAHPSKGAHVRPYPKEPYGSHKPEPQEKVIPPEQARTKTAMEIFMISFNTRWKKKHENDQGEVSADG